MNREITHNWSGFQEMFYPRKRVRGGEDALSGPIHVVVDQGTVVLALAEGENFAEWTGRPLKDFQAHAAGREVMNLERSEVDRWIRESLPRLGSYDQVEFLRGEAKSRFVPHFLLKSMESWWSKLLPSAYGVYISIETQPKRHLLVAVRRGKFEGFFEPDLSTLSVERRRQPMDVVKYISEKYLIPVQGVYVSAEEWSEWLRMPVGQNPWRKVAQSVRAERTRLIPFRWGVALLMTIRAFFGL